MVSFSDCLTWYSSLKSMVMKTMVFIFMSLCLICCKNDMKESQIDVQTTYSILLKNQAGENLLDPNVGNHYVHNEIYAFTLDSDDKEVVLTNNKVESLPEMPYFIRMVDFGIEDSKVNQATVYLRLSPTVVDTIKIEYKIESGNLYSTELWYNGELKWTKENDKPIEIVK